jgi:hypothetical protein
VTWLQQVFAYSGLLASLAVVVGLLRAEWRIARTFALYHAFMMSTGALVMFWPSVFWTWTFWLFRQTTLDALELAVAFELAYWIFLGFPGAASSARGTMVLLLVATFVAVVALPNENSGGPATLMAGLRPRLELGIAWLFTAILLMVRRYEIPLHPLHFAIVVGMVVNLCGFGLFVHAMGVWGLDFATGEPMVTITPAAFAGVCFWWAWRAWRPAPMPVASPGLVEVLQPWRPR